MTTPMDSRGGVQDGADRIQCMREFTLNLRILRHCTSFTWCSAGWVGSRLAIRGFFRAFCVRHKGQGEGGADAGSVPGVGPPCQLVSAVDDIATALKSLQKQPQQPQQPQPPRDGGIPQGCPLSMIFIVALYLPWCRKLETFREVKPQLYADNLKCVSSNDDDLLEAARFTSRYIRLVGQTPAPRKCALLSTSRVVRDLMKAWVISNAGDRWSVKLDVKDLGGHLDTTFRARAATLVGRVLVFLARILVVLALPLDFAGRLRVLRTKFLPGALQGIEASTLPLGLLRRLRSAFVSAVWSRTMPLAQVGAVLTLLDGPVGCDPGFHVVWCRFRLLRRYLAYRPLEVPRLYTGCFLISPCVFEEVGAKRFHN